MALYKLKAKSQYGDMPKGYEFQVISPTFPSPNAEDIDKEIKRLGFNADAQSYRSPGNWDIEKVS